MMQEPTRTLLKRQPLFLFLLPPFLLWHGCNALFGFISAPLAIHYLLLCAGWMLLCWLLAFAATRRKLLAAGIAFFLTLAFLFYGPCSDAARQLTPRLASYKLLPALLFLIALVVATLCFRSERRAQRSTQFLNWLLLVLLVVEGGTSLLRYSEWRQHRNNLFTDFPLSEQYRRQVADSARPDIYLLVLDEYAGARSLLSMGFDNTPFLDSLRRGGFWVARDSRSNYDFTPFSMASRLQMQYIDSSRERRGDDPGTILRAVRSISDNETMRILRREGYDLRFEASFDNSLNPAPTLNEFGDFAWKQLFGSSLAGRLRRDRALHIDPFERLFAPTYGYNDAAQRRRDLQRYRAGVAAAIDSNAARPPRFVYQHLLITHHPYLFDSTGRPRKRMATDAEEVRAYLDQVRYANAVQLAQVDHIRKGGRRNTVILLVSDHGYRQGTDTIDPFDNLEAVYYPDGDYSGLHAASSPVNLLRAVFNRHFGQHWPMLPARSVPVRYK